MNDFFFSFPRVRVGGLRFLMIINRGEEVLNSLRFCHPELPGQYFKLFSPVE